MLTHVHCSQGEVDPGGLNKTKLKKYLNVPVHAIGDGYKRIQDGGIVVVKYLFSPSPLYMLCSMTSWGDGS